jgi:hypothetical protein
MPEDSGEPTVNSTEAQSAVTAALDSVTVIDNIVSGADEVSEQTVAEKADDADRNYRHIEIMMEKSWFSGTATSDQTATLNEAITSGKTYYDANK